MLKASLPQFLGICTIFCATLTTMGHGQRSGAVHDLTRDARAMHASVIMVDVASDRPFYSLGDLNSRSTPGSVLKPFVLLTALRAHVMTDHDTVACRGTLTVAGHNLACSHPRDITVLDARQALANSCNTYFATVARRMQAETLAEGLRAFGIVPPHIPRDSDDRVLMALGIQGVAVSPSGLAEAYRKLALAINVSGDHAARVVEDGMVQSVQTGMAHAARVDGIVVGGKTGTVDDGGGRSHGWFAGILFDAAGKAQRVVVILVPNGNGNDAAALAKRVIAETRNAQ